MDQHGQVSQQGTLLLTGLLVVSALSLFLFACPQTVYTEVFLWIERKVEGDRTARMRLDGQLLSVENLGLDPGSWATERSRSQAPIPAYR